jgi:mono/diheme cytochrome c family protein
VSSFTTSAIVLPGAGAADMRLASAGLNNRSLVLENSGQQPVGETAARVRAGRSPYHRHKRVCRATLVAAGLFVAGSSLSAQHATAFDIEDGGRAFRNTCANCHGPDGDQIAGIDLGRAQFRRPLSDQELAGIIRNGIPNTPMPATNMSDAQATKIVATRSTRSGNTA